MKIETYVSVERLKLKPLDKDIQFQHMLDNCYSDKSKKFTDKDRAISYLGRLGFVKEDNRFVKGAKVAWIYPLRNAKTANITREYWDETIGGGKMAKDRIINIEPIEYVSEGYLVSFEQNMN